MRDTCHVTHEEQIAGEATWLLTWLETEGLRLKKPRSFARAEAFLTGLVEKKI